MTGTIPLIPQEFTCPYCWETISIVIDATTEDQEYVEDCEVCCNPILIKFDITDGEVSNFEASQAQ